MPVPTHFHDCDENLIVYDGSPLKWRVSAYGLIVRDDSILLLSNKKEVLHDIPGGGVEFGESIAEALQREAIEEAGASVEAKDLIYMYQDYFFHREHDTFFQTIQLFYEAELDGDLTTPTETDIEWAKFVQIAELDQYPLPKAVQTAIKKYLAKNT
jgi:8-oxo-dGTP diphosphatase